MPLTTGQTLQNRYRVVALLGEGGMGAVYRVWDLRLQKPLALKELVPQPSLDGSTRAELRTQFQQEAVILGNLAHPHLVAVTDYFEESGNDYLVMAFVEGENLAERIKREGALLEAQVIAWAKQLLGALAYCHQRGVIHRDIKPQNVVITPEGGAVLVDFGLVKLWDPADPRTRTVMRGMGTPEYAPPEQWGALGHHTDPRSDLYSLGATLYHALTGQAPLTASDRMVYPKQFKTPRELNGRVSPSVDAVITRAMTLAIDDRWPDAGAMAHGLTPAAQPPDGATSVAVATSTGTRLMSEAPQAPRPGRGRAPSWLWALGAVAAVMMLVAWASERRDRGAAASPTATFEARVTQVTAASTATKPAPPTATPKVAADSTPLLVAELPRRNVSRDRTLVFMWGANSDQASLAPYASGYTHQAGNAAQLEGLFYYSALQDKAYPWLAESYEYNSDSTECTVYLRKGVYWSDGEEFTADDVVFTFEMLKRHAPDLRNSSAVADQVGRVRATNDYEVSFELYEPNWRFHFDFLTFRFDRGVYIVPEHIYRNIADPLEFDDFFDLDKGWPVVTGPYQLVEIAEDHLYFDRRDDWWAVRVGLMDHLPYPERLAVVPYNGEELVANALINDEVDVTLDLRPATIEAIVEQSNHIVTYTGREKPYGYVDWWPISLFFNTLEWPYDDPRVRQAIAYAIDQQTVVDVGVGGAGVAATGPFPAYPSLQRYADASSELLPDYATGRDLDESARLMREAGFRLDGEGFWVDSRGVRPDADIYAGVQLFGDIAPVTAELLRQAGFDSEVESPPDVWTRKAEGTALLHLFGHSGSVQDPYETMQMYQSQWQRPTGEDCGPNRPRWGNEEYDAIVDEMSRTSPDDREKIQDLFNRGMEIWYDEMPEVPLIQWMQRVPMNTTYWTNWPSESNAYTMGPWHLTFPLTLYFLEPADG